SQPYPYDRAFYLGVWQVLVHLHHLPRSPLGASLIQIFSPLSIGPILASIPLVIQPRGLTATLIGSTQPTDDLQDIIGRNHFRVICDLLVPSHHAHVGTASNGLKQSF